MILNDILNLCINREISSIYIKGDKLFPYTEGKLTLKKHSVDGYFIIYDNIRNETLILISLRLNNTDKSFKNLHFTVSYSNDIIYMIEFDIYKIYFIK